MGEHGAHREAQAALGLQRHVQPQRAHVRGQKAGHHAAEPGRVAAGRGRHVVRPVAAVAAGEEAPGRAAVAGAGRSVAAAPRLAARPRQQPLGAAVEAFVRWHRAGGIRGAAGGGERAEQQRQQQRPPPRHGLGSAPSGLRFPFPVCAAPPPAPAEAPQLRTAARDPPERWG